MESINRSNKMVATWLLIGVGMTIIQIALGGITRLTGSGLSITQWEVVTGSLPPLNENQWMAEFDKYRQTPQFQLLNFDFTLKDFKFIFFWEWFHRLWARTIGMVFALGFVWFLLKKHFQKKMIRPLVFLFLMGALQGAVGWIMVASGLTGDAVYVKPTRLALHFLFAIGLLCYTYWFALSLLIKPSSISYQTKTRKWNLVLILLVIVQLAYGALMAGHKAANIAATWPTINGQWIPDNLIKGGFFLNAIDNKIFIHFIHRGLAYLIFLLIIFWTFQLFKTSGSKAYSFIRPIPVVLVLLQVVLGILTVVSSSGIISGHWGLFEWMAQLHQLLGMLLLLSLVTTLYIVKTKKTS
jgi:cytochrome c oxidase assembly protein subunit 15